MICGRPEIRTRIFFDTLAGDRSYTSIVNIIMKIILCLKNVIFSLLYVQVAIGSAILLSVMLCSYQRCYVTTGDVKVAMGGVKVAMGDVKVAMDDVKVAMGDVKVAMSDVKVAMGGAIWNNLKGPSWPQ